MNSKQLTLIKNFSNKFYDKTGRYHGWDHILLTHKYALRLASNYKNINKKSIEAACFLHDIGRVVKDDGHPQESVKIAVPFLKKIKVEEKEIDIISDAVNNHDKDKILSAKTIEARILFDADKLQILTVFGFIRVILWLAEERKMDMNTAVSFLWKYNKEVRKKYLYTRLAKTIVDKDFKILRKVIRSYTSWQEK